VFEYLEQLWMGIWQHTHTVTTTEVSPVLGELAEILDDVKGTAILGTSPYLRNLPIPLRDSRKLRDLSVI